MDRRPSVWIYGWPGAIAVMGVFMALISSTAAWGDAAAPGLVWVVGPTLAALVVSWYVPSPWLVLPFSVALVSMASSAAFGSSWAAATWWPLLLGVALLAARSRWLLLALTATAMVVDASTMTILQAMSGRRAMSGSVQYFLGMVGAVAAPVWFSVAVMRAQERWTRILVPIALFFVSLAVWLVLASGSRAALLGLTVAIAWGLIAATWSSPRRRIGFRQLVASIATVLLLVVGIDFGLGQVFGSGNSTVLQSLSGRAESTIREIESTGPTSSRVRLQFWRQAGRAMLARPLGHGPGSYEHVIHAYQDKPLLWSGSPHSMWALAAVEYGAPGLLALLAITLVALWRSARRRSAMTAALLAATAVMSLDVFSSMPAQSVVWWAALGSAWGWDRVVPTRTKWLSTGLVGIVAVTSISAAVRLDSTCDVGCKPIVRFGGYPSAVGRPLDVIGTNPGDPRWLMWRERYPMSYWLEYSHAVARQTEEPTAMIDVLRDFPFQSAQRYADVSDAFRDRDSALARDIAACGLARFFDGRPIWRDWRSSTTELADQRAALEDRAGPVRGDESACVRAIIPDQPVGLR